MKTLKTVLIFICILKSDEVFILEVAQLNLGKFNVHAIIQLQVTQDLKPFLAEEKSTHHFNNDYNFSTSKSVDIFHPDKYQA